MKILIASDIQHPYISRVYEDDEMTYTCDSCKCTFIPGNGYYLDGTSYNNIIGVGNGENFTTNKGTHQPVISLTQEYELINNTGKRGQVQLWIPSLGAPSSNFSSGKHALGAISFKIDALTDEKFEFKFVDTSSDGTKWSPEWCIMDSFFTVSAPTVVDGNTVVYVTGWDGVVLKTVNVRSDKDFTDWIDVQILIEMDPVYDYVTLSYYIDGKFVATASKDLTIKSNAINSIYISGYTSALDSGIILDDIFFGYSINGSWTPEILAETPEEETPAE